MKFYCILLMALYFGVSQANEMQDTHSGSKPNSTQLPKTILVNTESPSLQDTSLFPQLLQASLGLFLVLIIIGAAAWFARRFGKFHVAAKGSLRVVGGLHLGARERIVLVQVGKKQLLLGVAPGRINNLYTLEESIAVEEADSATPSNFAQKLAKAIRRQ